MSISPPPVIEIGTSASASGGEFHWSELAPGGLAAAVVIIGWIVAERFARERERRSDVRELSKSFGAAVDDVLAAANDFYLLAGSDPRALALAATIRAKVGALPRLLEALRDTGFIVEPIDQLKQFRQAVTGGDFDRHNRKASAAGAVIFSEMAAAGRSLTIETQISLIRIMSERGKTWRACRSLWKHVTITKLLIVAVIGMTVAEIAWAFITASRH